MKSLLDTIFDINKGTITAKDLSNKGMRSEQIKSLVESGELIKLKHGLYCRKDYGIDEFYLFQLTYSIGVFSYGTALFFHGLSSRVPNIVSYTVPYHYNVSRIKTSLNMKYHFVNETILNLGMIEIKTFQGNLIRVYDIERTICDIIKNKKHVDAQIYIEAIKTYFALPKINIRKLIKYAKILNVEEDILKYMEVLR